MDTKRLTRAVLRVGNGRGFVVSCRGYAGCEERIVITAAHCLPSLPPRDPAVLLAERTYATLLGPLGAKPTVWAECLLAETMADIAVLGMPDNQELTDEAEGYEQLMAKTQPLAIADPPAQDSERLLLPFGGAVERDTPGEAPVRLLSLKGRWVEGRVQRRGNWLGVTPQHIVASGMSGSPIISMAGEAIGVVSVTNRSPVLVDNLSVWLLRAICIAYHHRSFGDDPLDGAGTAPAPDAAAEAIVDSLCARRLVPRCRHNVAYRVVTEHVA